MLKCINNFLFFLLLFDLVNFISTENNTTEIEYPTNYLSNGEIIETIESEDSNISFENGYKGHCAEWGEHSAEEGQSFYIEPTKK